MGICAACNALYQRMNVYKAKYVQTPLDTTYILVPMPERGTGAPYSAQGV